MISAGGLNMLAVLNVEKNKRVEYERQQEYRARLLAAIAKQKKEFETHIENLIKASVESGRTFYVHKRSAYSSGQIGDFYAIKEIYNVVGMNGDFTDEIDDIAKRYVENNITGKAGQGDNIKTAAWLQALKEVSDSGFRLTIEPAFSKCRDYSGDMEIKIDWTKTDAPVDAETAVAIAELQMDNHAKQQDLIDRMNALQKEMDELKNLI